MTPPHTQALRGSNFAKPAVPAWRAGSTAAPRPAFYLTAVFVFVVYARFPEIMDMVTGSAVHSVRIIMLLALLATLLFGGNVRAVFSKVGICLIAFTLWMCIWVPFSIWRGGSVRMLRIIGRWRFAPSSSSHPRWTGAVPQDHVHSGGGHRFHRDHRPCDGPRTRGPSGPAGRHSRDANYLAMMLLMGVPFCLFVMRTKPGLSPLKFACR